MTVSLMSHWKWFQLFHLTKNEWGDDRQVSTEKQPPAKLTEITQRASI
jgi:hypothetical protein